MLQKLLSTKKSSTLTVLRVVVGVVFFAHGAQKMFGWFGGKGYSAALHALVPGKYVPVPLSFLAICAEFFGGLGLIVGLLTRVGAFGIAANMVVAMAMVEGHNGFFMNWEGQKTGEGYEYHLLVLAITYALMVRGGGALSVDRLVAGRIEGESL
jgi:putative oxidoreductase